MRLPSEILDKINYTVSRHNRPEDLDWALVAGQWIAQDNDRCFVLLHDTQFGYVVAEKKHVAYYLGADAE